MPLYPNMQPKDYLRIFARRKWLIIFSALVILFGASVYCVVVPERFRSSTTILVIPSRVPEAYVKSTVSLRIEDRLATIRQQVLSRTRLVAVMEELGLFKEERKKYPLEDVVEDMRKRITIEVRGADAFTLSFIHEQRQTAMLTTSRLASFFIDENLKTREQQAVGTADFLDSQLQETKKKLEDQEEKVRQYKSSFMGELPSQLTVNLAALSRLQDSLKANADSMRIAQDRKMILELQVNALETQIGTMEAQAREAKENSSSSTPIPVGPSGSAVPETRYLSELEAKKARLADLSQRFTEQYPEIRRSKAEIAALEAHIAEIRKNAPDNSTASSASPAARRAAPGEPRTASGFASRETEALQRHKTEVAALDMEIRSLKKEREEIGKRIASFEEKVARSPKREQEMISLTRDYDNLKRSYDELLRKKLDADVAQNLEKRQKGEQFQILDPANLPEEPFVPNRPKVFLIAVFCALLVGFGGSVGLEITDPTVREKKEFGHFTEILVLATIPSIHDKVFARRMVMRKAAIFGGLITFTLLVTAFLIVFGERVRTILQGVM